MMRNLNINTGMTEFRLNDAVSVTFNPTDINTIERLSRTFNELEALQSKYRGQMEPEDLSTDELFAIMHEADAAMRECLNAVFDVDICTPLVGDTHIYALADGLPIWANIVLALMDECDASAVAEQKKTNPRLEKYVARYEKQKTATRRKK